MAASSSLPLCRRRCGHRRRRRCVVVVLIHSRKQIISQSDNPQFHPSPSLMSGWGAAPIAASFANADVSARRRSRWWNRPPCRYNRLFRAAQNPRTFHRSQGDQNQPEIEWYGDPLHHFLERIHDRNSVLYIQSTSVIQKSSVAAPTPSCSKYSISVFTINPLSPYNYDFRAPTNVKRENYES